MYYVWRKDDLSAYFAGLQCEVAPQHSYPTNRSSSYHSLSDHCIWNVRWKFNWKKNLIHRLETPLFWSFNRWRSEIYRRRCGDLRLGFLGQNLFYLFAFVVDAHQWNDDADDAQPLCGRQSLWVSRRCFSRRSLWVSRRSFCFRDFNWRGFNRFFSPACSLFSSSQLFVCDDGISLG